MRRIAALGADNDNQVFSVDLALKGNDVRLYEPPVKKPVHVWRFRD